MGKPGNFLLSPFILYFFARHGFSISSKSYWQLLILFAFNDPFVFDQPLVIIFALSIFKFPKCSSYMEKARYKAICHFFFWKNFSYIFAKSQILGKFAQLCKEAFSYLVTNSNCGSDLQRQISMGTEDLWTLRPGLTVGSRPPLLEVPMELLLILW